MPEFTPEFLRNLPAPPRKPDGTVNQKIYFDPTFRGFGRRISSNGETRWVYQCRDEAGKTRRFTWPGALDLQEARAEAVAARRRVKSGATIEPAAPAPIPLDIKPAQSVETFGAVVARFLDHVRKNRKPRTVSTYQVLAGKHFAPLRDTPFAAVTRTDIARTITGMRDQGVNVGANRALAGLSAMYSWLLQRGEIDAPPVLRGLKVREHGRARHLAGNLEHGQPCEIPLFWRACEAIPLAYKTICELLLLTGTRRAEIADLQWSEIITGDALGPRIVLPAGRVKNGHAHTIPLGPYALSLLEAMPRTGDFVFTAPRGGQFLAFKSMKNALDAAVKRVRAAEPERYGSQLGEPFTFHDLRRTFASGLRQRGASLEVIDTMLNHRSGAANEGTRGVYIHADDWPERRAWAEKWEAHALEIGAA